MPWGSPSVSTCSKQSGCPHLRWQIWTTTRFFERFLTVFDCSNKTLIINCFLLLPDAGLHFTNDRPVRLWCFLRIYYTFLHKGMSGCHTRLFSLVVVCCVLCFCFLLLTFSPEWAKYNGGGSSWSLWLLHTWKGEPTWYTSVKSSKHPSQLSKNVNFCVFSSFPWCLKCHG